MSVVDASVVVEYVTDGGYGADAAAAVLRDGALAPELVHVEVCNSLQRLVRLGAISEPQALRALDRLHGLRLLTCEHLPLVDRVWEFRENLSAYDAAYLALAELMGERIATSDRGLATVAEQVLGADRVDFLP